MAKNHLQQNKFLKNSENHKKTEIRSSFADLKIIKDISAHPKRRDAKTLTKELSKEFLKMSSTIFMLIQNGIIVYANPACIRKLKHFSKTSLIGRNFSDLIFAATPTEAQKIANVILSEAAPSEENLISADNRILNVIITAYQIKDYNNQNISLIEAVDITKAVTAVKQQAISSCYDMQTGLPNALLLEDRLEMFIARSLRDAHGDINSISSRVCAISMELDSTQYYNNGAIDFIVENTGIRLVSGIRQMDTVARIEKTRLSIVIGDINHIDAAEIIARRIMGLIYEPISFQGEQVDAKFSIGIAVFPDNGAKAKALIQNSAKAKETSQNRGGGRYTLYSDIQPENEVYVQLPPSNHSTYQEYIVEKQNKKTKLDTKKKSTRKKDSKETSKKKTTTKKAKTKTKNDKTASKTKPKKKTTKKAPTPKTKKGS
ncbi:MAG: diguanylate cyclase [Alphaproteobacteria bacterium]|nr:diguanylate cyclase [Alphaproteobacteria bacterium]